MWEFEKQLMKLYGAFKYILLHGKGWIIIMDDAIGEFVFTSAYVYQFMHTYGINEIALVTNKKLVELAELYPFYRNVICLNDKGLKCLCAY